jgi:hypothetical protein
MRPGRTPVPFARGPRGSLPDRDRDRHGRFLRLSPARHVVRSGLDDAHRVRLPRPRPCRGDRCSARRGRDRRCPRSSGRFGRKLIAADEVTGRIYAFGPRGLVRLVAESGLPAPEAISGSKRSASYQRSSVAAVPRASQIWEHRARRRAGRTAADPRGHGSVAAEPALGASSSSRPRRVRRRSPFAASGSVRSVAWPTVSQSPTPRGTSRLSPGASGPR